MTASTSEPQLLQVTQGGVTSILALHKAPSAGPPASEPAPEAAPETVEESQVSAPDSAAGTLSTEFSDTVAKMQATIEALSLVQTELSQAGVAYKKATKILPYTMNHDVMTYRRCLAEAYHATMQ